MRVRYCRSPSHPGQLNNQQKSHMHTATSTSIHHIHLEQGDESAVLPLALTSWVKELSKRIPTLPHTKEKTAGSDGKLPEKLTVNSALGFEKQRMKVERNICYVWDLVKTTKPSHASYIRTRDLFKNKHRQKQISQPTRAKHNQDPKTTSHKTPEKSGQKALKAGNTLQES
ncbi:hypothetical protein F511_43842 [Dorcoceras hygrometricum]|uniref:Uncharacterized protein n=1 Tax=Dorcoceras hygrometricum TaxID=472368 RepID=A0A2Z7CWL6_9LAMI|nr:hypothetical protein F511_43842 [Dorcoceras hygrometricum]